MIFSSIQSRVNSFVRYFDNSIWIISLLGLLYGGTISMVTYYQDGVVALIVIIILLLIVFFRISILRFIKQGKIINHYVNYISVERAEISFSTIRLSAFLGLLKKEPISFKIKGEKIRFKKADEKYGNPKRTGIVYLLIYKGEEFAIAEKCFENIGTLICNC